MRMLNNVEAYFEIIQTDEELKNNLLRIERLGRISYQSYVNPITPKTAEKFIRMIMKRGHESVLEHSVLTVIFYNISRGTTHEIVRHRLAGITQESTRYVDYSDLTKTPDYDITFISPPGINGDQKIELDDGRCLSLREMFREEERFYRALRKNGCSPEKARQILPIGIASEIGFTANFREWRHIFELRTKFDSKRKKGANWEIRKVMADLLKELKVIIPVIFEDFREAGQDDDGIPFYEKIKSG